MSTHTAFVRTADAEIIAERQSAAVPKSHGIGLRVVLWLGALVVGGLVVWQGVTAAGLPDPLRAQTGSIAGVLDIAVLVFREGLECILVLAAITASMANSDQPYQRPVVAGAGVAFVATLLTWRIAIGVVDDLTQRISALDVQAGTGLLAVFVLIVVMNWFFHKVYWTGWISMHNKRKRSLLESAHLQGAKHVRLLLGFGLLGFTSLYREGFEVVLFLQSFRLKLGNGPIFYGVLLGLLFSSLVAILTFVAHRRLPYRKMLVLTGVLLGCVLLVMVGEQAQEMQMAHWLPTTTIHWLVHFVPGWMGLWFSVFPTVETLVAQGLALFLVVGCYVVAHLDLRRNMLDKA